MNDSNKNKNYLKPVKLLPEWLDFANKANIFFNRNYPNYPFNARKVLESIFHNLREENIVDKDRVQTIASKMRGFLYPIFSNNITKDVNTEIQILNIAKSLGTKYFSNKEVPSLLLKIEELKEINSKIMDLDHYCIKTESATFDKNPKKCQNYSLKDIRSDLEKLRVLFPVVELLTLITHQIIDTIIAKAKNGSPGIKDKENLEILLNANEFDAKNYFYTQADWRWLSWLWDNGFVDEAITKQPEDTTRYGYWTPEISYLVRVAKQVPKKEKIVEIILDPRTATSEKKFNPELVDQFLRICAELPAQFLKKVIEEKFIKQKQNWLKLMSKFNPYGFEYAKMFETLYKAGEVGSLLKLAEIVLAVKSKKELEEKTIKFGDYEFPTGIDNPFYFKDASYIQVFDYLAKIEDEKYIEKAFRLVAGTMAEIIKVRGKLPKRKDGVFAIDDFGLLLDEDFFEIDLKERTISAEENIANLAAAMKILAEKFITKHCQSNPKKVKDFFRKHIGMFNDKKAFLPDSKAMWRFRLFVLSLCPKAFKEELKKSFWRLFKAKGVDYYQIMSGAEYGKALQKSFANFNLKDRREYVNKVIKYFVKQQKEEKDKEAQKEKWHLKYGSRILSVIMNDQAVKERGEEIKKLGFILDKNYKPTPSISRVRGGTVVPRGPIMLEEFHKKSIEEIIKKLKSDWAPEKLRERNKGEDFLRPLNAEGAGNLIKNDIPKRFQDYIDKAVLFFDRKKLDPHYTYSFLRGIQEALRDNKVDVQNVNWENLLKLFAAIRKSGEENSFDREKRDRSRFDSWLANWTAVHSAMVDVIQELLKERNGRIIIDFKKYRPKIFKALSYLLEFSDPIPADEQLDTAKSKTQLPNDSGYIVSDPYSIAINTVRGRAFEAFVMFVYLDGKLKFKKDDKIQITDDAKKLYEEILAKESTRAIMFMFGHYLPSFYFRDEKWIRGLLPQIFPERKKYLFLAATEGYLTQSLYKEIFFDKEFRKLYEKWIELENTKYPNQKHYKDIDEALADHLALAFVHFDIDINKDKGFSDELLKKFWSGENPNNQKRYHEFISFIGRHILSRDNANVLIKHHKIKLKKIERFWDWALVNIKDPKAFSGFGYWVNPNEEVIEDKVLAKKMAKTLEKSGGKVDWEYGLFKRLPVLAEVDRKNTLEIIRNYFLDKNKDYKELNQNRFAPIYQEEIKKALEIIYGNGSEAEKKNVTELIDTLIQKGSSMFWFLEDIVK